MSFDRDKLKLAAERLAELGIWIGTSSWKYPGWRGTLYDEQRYVWRGRFSESRFENHCLTEYAEVFKTVCVDAAYYKFPDSPYVEKLISQVPTDFKFGLKVTDEITVKRFTNLPRFGSRAGKFNENFLNADLFADSFVKQFKPFRSHVGMFIFEFSKFYPSDYGRGRDFLEDLDRFLTAIPKGWPYGVEIRNSQFLQPEYLALLSRHKVSHVFNSCSDMPGLQEQLAVPGSITNPELSGARLLLKPGRKFQEAVDFFSPYDKTKEINPEIRKAAAALIRQVINREGPRKALIFVNNRLEGNALMTIMAIAEEALGGEAARKTVTAP